MKKYIKTIAEVTLEELEQWKKNNQYSQIGVVNDNKELDKENSYTVDEMIMIKEKVKDITTDIHGKFTEPDYQKKVFTYIYTKLANLIEYDEYGAHCCELGGYEREMTEKFRELASNLTGGLVNGKSICSGYSEILRNVLSEVGIDSLYISGKEKNGNAKHAWNQVKLDGNWYNVDLTQDRDDIIEGKECENFLKSDREFGRYTVYDVVSPRKEKCNDSIQNQDELFNECKFIPVTTKVIAEETKSRSIGISSIHDIKKIFTRILNKNIKEKE